MCIDLWTVVKFQSQQNIFEISNVYVSPPDVERPHKQILFVVFRSLDHYLDQQIFRLALQMHSMYISDGSRYVCTHPDFGRLNGLSARVQPEPDFFKNWAQGCTQIISQIDSWYYSEVRN